ncbi:hypothetical protein FBY31_4459 [Arthrobacter sp. SLBN-100]|uniref:hypothetical protein n=1 Tax=Arthrobacter sp. SLBN-100 TaxID=2768450 RepID=UPI0011512F06|nr:hypothetical protein [Arthrobacter sp. SLBN-100]TQJ62080.1 hypothetical protein FBY31_4459 [Arthrobacter sp. SLBN-100]
MAATDMQAAMVMPRSRGRTVSEVEAMTRAIGRTPVQPTTAHGVMASERAARAGQYAQNGLSAAGKTGQYAGTSRDPRRYRFLKDLHV